jgi:hypothetical protein
VGRSHCCLLGVGIVVVGEAGIPPFEERPQRTVKGVCSCLQQQMRPARRPLHLLTEVDPIRWTGNGVS